MSAASGSEAFVRRATAADAADVARLLHDFNTEFDEPTPPVATLAERVEQLLGARALYESAGFTNREGDADGPRMLYYERDLQPPAG